MIIGTDINLQFQGRPILKNVSIELKPGKIVVLCGPNGAGKSTLLSCLAGEHKECAHRIFYETDCLNSLTPRQQAYKRAVLEQSPTLTAAFTVRELVHLGAPIELTPAETKRLCEDVIDQLNLTDFTDRFVETLSGGQRHRAHLARTLVQLKASKILDHNSYLFLDEPTASLDIAHQIKVLSLMRQLSSEGFGILIVLHDLNLAAAFCDQAILMKNGQVFFTGTPPKVFTSENMSTVYETPIIVERASTNQMIIQPTL